MKNKILSNQYGFTLVELLIVIIILSILAAISIPSYMLYRDRAKESATEAEMRSIANSLEIFSSDNTRYPYTDEGLIELKDSNFKNIPLSDKWGNFYGYISNGNTYTLRSNGIDGIEGNSDDIVISNGIMTSFGSYYGRNDDTKTVLFESNFKSMNGLDVLMGEWNIDNGLLKPSTEKYQNRIIFGDENWKNYMIETNVTLTDVNSDESGGYGVYYRVSRNEFSYGLDGYIFQYDPGLGDRFAVYIVSDGVSEERIQSVKMNDIIKDFNIYNSPYKLNISVQDNQHKINISDQEGNEYEIFNFEDDTYASGFSGFRSWRYPGVNFEDVEIYQQ